MKVSPLNHTRETKENIYWNPSKILATIWYLKTISNFAIQRLIPVGLNAVKRGGRRLFSGQPPSNASCPSKAKQPVACAHPTPKAEAPAADKKCPVFCSHSEKQCPPLVPPVTVGPKTPPALAPAPGSTSSKSPQQPIPTSAIVAYRMAL